jgi:hypothetical protein
MKRRTKRFQALVVVICHLLALQPAFSQQAGVQRGLKIVIVEGGGARNVVRQIPPRPLAVRILDANDQPVAGATVDFSAPQVGPSGEFANDSRSYSVTSDQDGLAVASGYHPNSIEGPYQIRVRAEFQGQTASELIPQTNIAQKKGRGKLYAIIGIVGAAAAAIAFRGGSNGSSGNAPTITFGGGAVGAPR